jgi:hypothetical protein
MSFKVKDLSVSLSVDDGGSTCTTLTKPTGCAVASIFGQREGAVRRQDLAALKTQLRDAMARV